MTDAPAFASWLDDFFARYYRRNPVGATFIGMHAYDHLLPDYSSAALAEAGAEINSLRQRLDTLPAQELTPAQQIDRTLAEGALEIQHWELTAPQFQAGNPCVYTGEAIFGVISLFLRDFAPLPERAAAAVARMRAIPAFLAQGQANLRSAPAAWVARARRECTGALAFLGGGIDQLIAEYDLARLDLRAAGDEAAAAFAAFDRFLERELRATEGGYSCGADALDLYLRHAHFLAQDADAIAAYARAVIADCQAALVDGAAAFGVDDWHTALAGLADLHPSTETYYGHYATLWEQCRAVAVEQNLLTWPEYPLRYVPQPAWAREAAPALYFLFYRAPATFDRVPIVEYLVTPIEPDMPAAEQQRRLRATNTSVIKLNHVVHHGAIGHHVQNWHARRAESRIGQIAAVDTACRIALPCGGTMAEGWACYATDVMDEAGFLSPLESYSQHQARLRMATRALVDVELHCGHCTLAEAERYYVELAGMNPEAAHSEAVKNSMFPGAALIYLLGTDQIHALRRAVAAREGDTFNLARFHDRMLAHGSIPVALIARAMLSA